MRSHHEAGTKSSVRLLLIWNNCNPIIGVGKLESATKDSVVQPELNVLPWSTGTAVPTIRRCLCSQPHLPRMLDPWPAGLTKCRSSWAWGHWGWGLEAWLSLCPPAERSAWITPRKATRHWIQPVGSSLEPPELELPN